MAHSLALWFWNPVGRDMLIAAVLVGGAAGLTLNWRAGAFVALLAWAAWALLFHTRPSEPEEILPLKWLLSAVPLLVAILALGFAQLAIRASRRETGVAAGA